MATPTQIQTERDRIAKAVAKAKSELAAEGARSVEIHRAAAKSFLAGIKNGDGSALAHDVKLAHLRAVIQGLEILDAEQRHAEASARISGDSAYAPDGAKLRAAYEERSQLEQRYPHLRKADGAK